MRLAEGILVDNEKTFGELKFSAMRRERFVTDDEGNVTSEIKDRTYDLKSRAQGDMIQVTIPASVPKKNFGYNDKVVLVNPVVQAISSYGMDGQESNWFVSASDILLSDKAKQNTGNKEASPTTSPAEK